MLAFLFLKRHLKRILQVGNPANDYKRSPRWWKVRLLHLARESACQWCGGRTNIEVHHIAPFHLFPESELLEVNLITLCEAPGLNCHFEHGHRARGSAHSNWHDFNPNIRADCRRHQQEVNP